MTAHLRLFKPTALVVTLALKVWTGPGGVVLGKRVRDIISNEQGNNATNEGSLYPLIQISSGRPSWASGLHAATYDSKGIPSSHVKAARGFLSGNEFKVTRLPILPYPKSVVEHSGDPFLLRSTTRVSNLGGVPESEEAFQAVVKLIRGAPSGRSDEDSKDCDEVKGTIQLRLDIDALAAGADPESYNLTVSACKVELVAPSLIGLFYGVQTLQQLSSGGRGRIPAVTIMDEPRLKWRGLHLDVSRHFFSADKIKSLIDTIAYFKFNRFHWHLTDDQGWRMPVNGFPKLIEIGSRNENGEVMYYTAEQIQDIVDYASARHVEILPEVDVPGHAAAAIASYPELGNVDSFQWKAPIGPERGYGMKEFTLSPTDATMSFIDQVFGQIADYFPGEFVHVGGDEAPTSQWESSTIAQTKALAKQFSAVQSLFSEKVSQTLHNLNKTVVAWDEAQHMLGLPDDAVIMAWRSQDELVTAVRGGKRAINAVQENYYFDHAQAHESEPRAICCYLPLQKVYEYDPVPPFLRKEEMARVMGAQGQLWSEYLPSWNHVEYFAFPRSLALAERMWTPNTQIEDHGYEEFLTRLRVRLKDLDARGVKYRKLDDE